MFQSELNIISHWDKQDQKLAEQVLPSDWMSTEPAVRYNLVVVGAGTAGLASGARAAGLGAKVALIGRHIMEDD